MSMIQDGEYSGKPRRGRGGMIRTRAQKAIVAGGFPVKPSGEWFTQPKFGRLTPLTITADGRVSGHIAAWHQSHIGMAGSIRPPRSRSKYAFFKTGQLETAEGDLVDVGQVTLSGGHAPLSASVPQVVEHYDNTQSAVMDVAVFEDNFGISVAGALRPDVTPAQLRQIRASGVSGDWRPINNNLELVAVCAVNVPGFPIPRARIASGTPVALVAAGVEPIVDLIDPARRVGKSGSRRTSATEQQSAAIIAALVSRVDRLETIVAGAALDTRSQLDDAIVAAVGTTPTAPPADQRVEELRSRVHSDKQPVTASAAQWAQAHELRQRVHASR